MLLLMKRALVSTYLSQGWNADRAILLLWLGPPILAALISAIYMPVFLSRTLSGTLVPAYLAIGSAIARTGAARERRILAAAICLCLLPTTIALTLRPAGERWDLLSTYLSRNVAPQDQVWLYPSDSAIPLAAVGQPIKGAIRSIPATFPTLGVKGPIRAGWPAVVSVTPEQAAKLASDPAIADVPVIWLVTRQSDIFDPDGDMPAALARVRRPGTMEQWGYINVRPYYRR
jgi:mannosyltransferase